MYATRFQRHSVQKTGFSCTEVIFGTGNPLLRYRRNIRCAEQPPGVPNEAEEFGSGSEFGYFAKTAICMCLFLPLNSCRQLWVATKPLQIAANRHQIATDCRGLPQTTANSAKLSQAARKATPPILRQPYSRAVDIPRAARKAVPRSAVNLPLR